MKPRWMRIAPGRTELGYDGVLDLWNLKGNQIGDDGLMAIAEVIAAGAMPRLKAKGLQTMFNPASRAAQDALRKAFSNERAGRDGVVGVRGRVASPAVP